MQALTTMHGWLGVTIECDLEDTAVEIAQTRTNIGVTFGSINQYPEALESLQAALEIYETLGDELAVPAILSK